MSTVKFVDNQGNEINCEILFSYNSEKSKKKYIIYTDNTMSEEQKNVYASEYIEEVDITRLKDIEDVEDKKAIERLIENL